MALWLLVWPDMRLMKSPEALVITVVVLGSL
jgi:hypothetical protein